MRSYEKRILCFFFWGKFVEFLCVSIEERKVKVIVFGVGGGVRVGGIWVDSLI